MTFSSRKDSFIYNTIDYIENAYDSSKINYFYMLGDGALWIKNLKYYFNYNSNIKIIQSLDKYHFKQNIWKTLPDKSVYNTLCEYIVSDNKDEYKRLISEIIDLHPDRNEKIEKYKNYILNN